MSQRLHNTEGWEDDKGQEQSRPAPLQQIPAATSMSATRMPAPGFPAAPATGSADTETSAGVDNTTTSLSVCVQSPKQVEVGLFLSPPTTFQNHANTYKESILQLSHIT